MLNRNKFMLYYDLCVEDHMEKNFRIWDRDPLYFYLTSIILFFSLSMALISDVKGLLVLS
jgi:hypothetical protein